MTGRTVLGCGASNEYIEQHHRKVPREKDETFEIALTEQACN